MAQTTYAHAIRDAHAELLRSDQRVFVIGGGVWSPWYAGATLTDLDKEFGRRRVLDTPLSENAVTGAAVGAALVGMRPIVFHARMDFMLLAVDPIVNQASNWSYLFSGKVSVPVVFRSVINRGGQQGAQHSQALHGMFMQVPGLKVVMPATPYDAKGLLVAAVKDPNPVLYVDDRWLYEDRGEVPSGLYEVPIGRAAIRRRGADVTIVAVSYLVREALAAAEGLALEGIEVEVVDLRTVKPWDKEMVLASVTKTGRLVVADSGWATGGVSAEIAATVACDAFSALKSPIVRVALPDCPAPTSRAQESAYYIAAREIVVAARKVVAG